jgi:adenosylhomocysteine nucleosidase
MQGQGLIVAATGLVAEARHAERSSNVKAVAGGGDAQRLSALLEAALELNPRGIISFGIAGGLAPAIATGTYVVGTSVLENGNVHACDPGWTGRLASALPRARSGPVAGVSTVIASANEKAALYAATGALAADMESHVVARFATKHGLPFAVLRVIADDPDQALPPAATVGLKADGTPNVGAVMRSLAGHPGQLADLLRVAVAAQRAMKALFRCHRLLGPGLGFADLG